MIIDIASTTFCAIIAALTLLASQTEAGKNDKVGKYLYPFFVGSQLLAIVAIWV